MKSLHEVAHFVTIDFVSGYFEGTYYCSEERRTYHWRRIFLDDVKKETANILAGSKFQFRLTQEARSARKISN